MKLHAKMILVDGKRAVIRSINLAPGSFDARRKLAIDVDRRHVVERLGEVARQDWENSRPIDLSDEGLRADLGKRGIDATDKLALDREREKNNKNKNKGDG